MSLQVIKSIHGKAEYVLLPMLIYRELHDVIEEKLKSPPKESEYVLFNPEDYISNPIALARIKVHITQAELAERLEVSQAYVSKIERQEKVTPKVLKKVNDVLKKSEPKHR